MEKTNYFIAGPVLVALISQFVLKLVREHDEKKKLKEMTKRKGIGGA